MDSNDVYINFYFIKNKRYYCNGYRLKNLVRILLRLDSFFQDHYRDQNEDLEDGLICGHCWHLWNDRAIFQSRPLLKNMYLRDQKNDGKHVDSLQETRLKGGVLGLTFGVPIWLSIFDVTSASVISQTMSRTTDIPRVAIVTFMVYLSK